MYIYNYIFLKYLKYFFHNRKMKLVVGLLSCCSKEEYLEQINACTQTWCKDYKNIFFLNGEACHSKEKCMSNVIHLKNVGDDVMSATYKQWEGLIWLYQTFPSCDFYYIAGTDTYARLDKLEEYLKTLNPQENIYLGGDGMTRADTGKEIYYHSGGCGFILSNSLLKAIVPHIPMWIQYWNRYPEWISIACDWSIASLFSEMNIPIKTIKLKEFKACNWQGLTKGKARCCNEEEKKENIWVYHYMDSDDMKRFEKYLKAI